MVQELLDWYDLHQRSIPWRCAPTPYAIWVSEIMCQQTRIETVIPYYLRFMEELPTIEALANCEEDKLLKLWQGLGYYNRVRNLQLAARDILHRFKGVFPNAYEDVISLKGIGAYTASAILSISFQQRYAAVDGNFLRVFSRLWADDKDISLVSTKQIFKEKIEAFMPERSGDFNQAVMDLGATICVPNEAPHCEVCPLKHCCKAFHQKNVLDYPVKTKKQGKKEEELTVFLIEWEDKIVLRKRQNQGLLKGLYEFKNVEGKLSMSEVRKLFPNHLLRITKGPTKTHVFTHRKWIMYSYYLKFSEYFLEEREFFATKELIETQYTIPTAFSQFLLKLKNMNI